MRVVAGTLRGRTIASAESPGLRPTADRTRETLFNMIASRFDLEDVRALDLYAGTGALGIEALSRGALHCTFVERERNATRLIHQNLAALGLHDRAAVVNADTLAWLARASESFGLIVADPPYALARTLPTLLDAIVANRRLAPHGLLVVECAEAVPAPVHPALQCIADRTSGAARIALYREQHEE